MRRTVVKNELAVILPGNMVTIVDLDGNCIACGYVEEVKIDRGLCPRYLVAYWVGKDMKTVWLDISEMQIPRDIKTTTIVGFAQ